MSIIPEKMLKAYRLGIIESPNGKVQFTEEFHRIITQSIELFEKDFPKQLDKKNFIHWLLKISIYSVLKYLGICERDVLIELSNVVCTLLWAKIDIEAKKDNFNNEKMKDKVKRR